MANREQVNLLKDGVEGWNKWRKESLEAAGFSQEQVVIDLSEGNFWGFDLSGAYLMSSNLSGAKLGHCRIEGAFLSGSNLKRADLMYTDLRNADLSQTDLAGADLSYANLSGANLGFANFWHTILRETDLSGAKFGSNDLREVIFDRVILSGSDFGTSIFGKTIFADVDLSGAQGLENVTHAAPSSISTSTFIRSRGRIPEVFLRGCALEEWEIEFAKLYDPELNKKEANQILKRIRDLRP